MPRISILRLTDPEAVRKAIAEHDRLGAQAFRELYEYGEADHYFLLHDGRKYDSKAIAGVAYQFQHGGKVTHRDFDGGEKTVARALERLDFEVTRPEPRTGKTQYSANRSSATRRELAAAWSVEETPTGYQPRTRRPAEIPEPSTTPVALLSRYEGPRRVASRTAAEPRVEDPEAYDRANEAHEVVRSALADFLRVHGFSVHDSSSIAKQHNVDFDLAADGGELHLVIEAKSMPIEGKPEAGRLRLGLGQVLWYRHRFLAVCGERRVPVLAVGRAPRDHEDWLAACRGANVVLTWPERFVWLVDECRCARALW